MLPMFSILGFCIGNCNECRLVHAPVQSHGFEDVQRMMQRMAQHIYEQTSLNQLHKAMHRMSTCFKWPPYRLHCSCSSKQMAGSPLGGRHSKSVSRGGVGGVSPKH